MPQWMLLAAIAGMISTDPPIPDIRFTLVPIGRLPRRSTIGTCMGLRGTGSKIGRGGGRVRAGAPRRRQCRSDGGDVARRKRRIPSPLYRAPTWAIFPFCITSPTAGIAHGACECFIAEMKARASAIDHSPLARKPSIQMRVAEATALADAAELLYRRSLTETIDKVMAGETLSLEHRLRSRRDQGYAVVMAKRAASLLFEAQGGGGLYERGPGPARDARPERARRPHRRAAGTFPRSITAR